MTNDEKIKRHDALGEIKKRIGGCFGIADKIFAGHPNDEGRAKDLRNLAEDAGITLDEMQDILAGHLQKSGFPKDHVDKQMKNASDYFGKKLSWQIRGLVLNWWTNVLGITANKRKRADEGIKTFVSLYKHLCV